MKKSIIAFVIFLMSISFSIQAQDYLNSLGLRAGLSTGITYKHFTSRTDALEGILTTRWGGFTITGLYERHGRAFDTDNLYYYYGGGAHLGVWSGRNNPWFTESNSYTVIGVDGIIGLEYVFEEIPFNISLDWKPGFNIIGHTGFWGDEVALSFRYIFN
jgi:hypothetical protein